MGLIVLLRHGQASFGAADYDNLSELGRRQSVTAGLALGRRGLRNPVITSGTLLRQRDTARIAGRAMAGEGHDTVEWPADPRWNEYDHVGMVEDHAAESGTAHPTDSETFQALLDRALALWVEADAPDGWRAFADGARAALDDLGRRLGPGRDAVVATSGGVIAAVCSRLLDLGAPGVVSLNRVVVNGSFTTIAIGSSGPSLISFNDHAHFTGPAATQRTYR